VELADKNAASTTFTMPAADVSIMAHFTAESDVDPREELNASIEVADELDEADYTPDSWEALQDALEAAKAVAEDAGATEDRIAEALDDLEAAMNDLIGISADKADLNTQIANGENLTETDYTPDSWEIFQEKLAAAKAVRDNPNATAKEIADALTALNQAVRNMQQTPVAVAKGRLKFAIELAKNLVTTLDEMVYTPASWEALERALETADQLVKDVFAAEQAINDARNALDDAIDDLEPNPATEDKSGLDAAIRSVAGLNEANYTAASWAALESALNNARTVANDPEATEAQITDAINELKAAVNGLQLKPVVADKATLNARIAVAEGLQQGDYTAASWTQFQTALSQAKVVVANTNATQTQVNAAVSSLNLAMNRLQHETVSVDKTQLNAFIAYAKELNEANYDAASWAAFEIALADADAVSANAGATQAQVTDAYNALQYAVDNLKDNPDSGDVRDLIVELTDEVANLKALADSPFTRPLALLLAPGVDVLRDGLVGLLGGAVDPVVEGVDILLDTILIDLGLESLI
jgi:hypothetical protein